jgi:hypothetical protein
MLMYWFESSLMMMDPSLSYELQLVVSYNTDSTKTVNICLKVSTLSV